MSDIRTWIRVQDQFGQFDHDKSRPVPDGVEVVKGYPEHVGAWARTVKPHTDKAGQPTPRPARRAARGRSAR